MAEVETVRDVRICGRRLRVSMRAGQGRPLLMCNGIGARLELLEPFLDRFDPSIPVIRFDVPGLGGSELPCFPYNFATLASMLGRVLRELDCREVDVLGISWGGGLAQQFAFQNPRRCRRLVLVGTATGMLMVPAGPRVLSKMITPRRYRDPAYAAAIAPTIYGGALRARPGLAQEILFRHGSDGPRLGYALQLLAGAGWTSLPFLPLIRQPTLILAGDDDPIVPVINARIMHRLMPGSTLHVYPDGHLGLITLADQLAPRVAEFLRPGRS